MDYIISSVVKDPLGLEGMKCIFVVMPWRINFSVLGILMKKTSLSPWASNVVHSIARALVMDILDSFLEMMVRKVNWKGISLEVHDFSLENIVV